MHGELIQDARHALRTLRRSPGFTIVAVLTLALGIGANSAIFSFVDGVLLRPLPYDHPERIVRLDERMPSGLRNGAVSTATFLDWRDQSSVFDVLAATAANQMTLTGVDRPT